MTVAEYEILMEAERLKQVDNDYRQHLQAYLNYSVKATKGSGKHAKPAYKKFKQFYDYEKELQKARNKDKQDNKSKFSGVGSFFRKESE